MTIPADGKPTIAVLGNMNNNGFAQMRYFRDLGAEAVVMPFSTDAAGAAAHFAPQSDTYRWDEWRDYVRPLPVPNSNEAIVGKPHRLRGPTSLGPLREALAAFDHVLGTGIAPALMERIERPLDGFGPYSVGIEFYGTPRFAAIARQRSLRGMLHRRVQRLQARGIRRAGVCFNADMGLTRESFEQLDVAFEPLPMPMVYNGEPYAGGSLTGPVRQAADRMRAADLALFTASRQLWVRPDGLSERGWQCTNKNSDWLFRALAAFLQRFPKARPLLVAVEYGADVDSSKRLAAELGIEQFVLWLPVIPRREILGLLAYADIGCGEFLVEDGLLWGGTGFEVLSAGRPLLQTLNFTHDDFVRRFGYAPPPLLDAKSCDEVTIRIGEIFEDRGRAARIGSASAEWFDAHAGIGLARRWLDAVLGARRERERR
ncbi:MAG: hypothetical protein ACEQR8_03775 [Cypionkella sp.]